MSVSINGGPALCTILEVVGGVHISGRNSHLAIFYGVAGVTLAGFPGDGGAVGGLAANGQSQVLGLRAVGRGLEEAVRNTLWAGIVVVAVGHDLHGVVGALGETFDGVGVLVDCIVAVEHLFAFGLVADGPGLVALGAFSPSHGQTIFSRFLEHEVGGSRAGNGCGEVDDVANLAVAVAVGAAVSLDADPVVGFGVQPIEEEALVVVGILSLHIGELLVGGIFNHPGILVVVDQRPAEFDRSGLEIVVAQSTNRVAGRCQRHLDVVDVKAIPARV